MKLILFVEGRGERLAIKEFLKRWLDKRTLQPVGLFPVLFDGWPEMVKDIPIKVPMYLQRQDVLGVVSLLDLYGPTFYPDTVRSSRERWDFGRKHVQDMHPDPRFRHFFACHEFEAWLFSNPSLFPAPVRQIWPSKLKAPEEINFTQTPKTRLDALYEKALGKGYKPTRDGKALFGKLDPEAAAEKCPRLKEFLHGLLEMAKPHNLVKPEYC